MSTLLYIAAGWQWAQGDLWWGILWFILGMIWMFACGAIDRRMG